MKHWDEKGLRPSVKWSKCLREKVWVIENFSVISITKYKLF